ncbi:MAG: hypothetical protein IJ679_00410 [Lachnospiraceae bacterium]|nr:hypothetical protein [Lachnospiraceae bacterium]
MAINVQEYYGRLFDQLEIVERIEESLNESVEIARAEIERQKRNINRKLYQNPPLY